MVFFSSQSWIELPAMVPGLFLHPGAGNSKLKHREAILSS